MHVLDAAGVERGRIDSEGIVPGIKYVMRRDGTPVWVLSVRSIVRKRHMLEFTGERWTFHTPFFCMDYYGTVAEVPRVVGFIGPTKRHWAIAVDPERDNPDLLAAVAYLHRIWLQW